MPISGLRLSPDIVSGLTVLGFQTIGELSATPRAPLALRFGPEIGRRLDQMFGRVAEPIDPIRTAELIEVSPSFAEPIGAAETIAKYVGRLVVELCAALQTRGLGVRRTDLIVDKVDNTMQAIRAGTAKPARDVAWLTKLFRDPHREDRSGLRHREAVACRGDDRATGGKAVVSSLVEETDRRRHAADRRFRQSRRQRVYRVAPVASDVPERSVAACLARCRGRSVRRGRLDWPRPVRLLARPELIEVIALLPDHPPVSITWRGKRRRVKRADGPERIFGEWWERNSEMEAVRDYFVIEDEDGERFWIFAPATASIRRPDRINGSCTGYSHEIRRTPGHDPFLLPARSIIGATSCSRPQGARHRGARRRRPQLACRDRPGAGGVPATGVRLVVGCRLDLQDGMSILVYPTDRAAYSRL